MAVSELTAFVREVVLPGTRVARPRMDASKCRFRVRSGRSPIHRWGIFAAEAIPARRRVIEYTGERITRTEGYRRRLRHHLYLFRCSQNRVIDGAPGGSGAEFINHSFEPNLRAQVRKGRIFYVTLRPIRPGEELLIDYQVTGDDLPRKCHCGAKSCRGTMNRPAP
jgi:SET domain-containing protein